MPDMAHRLLKSDNINTEHILSARYKFKVDDPGDLTEYLFADIEEGFKDNVGSGDFLVAGENFGCGSSRELPVAVLRGAGFRAVVAKSFSRIFYRNAFNLGLFLVQCETNYIDDMDELQLDLDNNVLRNLTKGFNLEIQPIPPIMRRFLDSGGAVEYFKKHKGFDDVK
ncbi:MAG: 3-isopropylmalate dehydratase [Candidatus Omnitrophica bacterium]|nr:3-isopropylmalate dehydratase [Candidatus Omnitrophota bacterium]